MRLPRCLFVLAVLLCSTTFAADPAKLTVENYNKVEIGADIEMVYELLGKETIADSDFGGGNKNLRWQAGGKMVLLGFQKNRVRSKAQFNLLD